MSLSLYQRDFAYCLEQASQWLERPACALLLPWHLEQLLRKRIRSLRAARAGVGARVGRISEDCAEGELSVGMEMFELATATRTVGIVRVVLPYMRAGSNVPDFWAVAEADYRFVYKFMRRPGKMRRTDRGAGDAYGRP